MTVPLPELIKDWNEAQISRSDYVSTSDYVRDLVRRDRGRREQEFTLDELRKKLADSRSSGKGIRSVDDIFAEAQDIARALGFVRG